MSLMNVFSAQLYVILISFSLMFLMLCNISEYY